MKVTVDIPIERAKDAFLRGVKAPRRWVVKQVQSIAVEAVTDALGQINEKKS